MFCTVPGTAGYYTSLPVGWYAARFREMRHAMAIPVRLRGNKEIAAIFLKPRWEAGKHGFEGLGMMTPKFKQTTEKE